MKIVVGLGNPGHNYKKNRHNTGFMTVDLLAQKLGVSHWQYKKNFKADFCQAKSIGGELYLLVKPQTFMNNSGESVLSVLDYYKNEMGDNWQENLFVVYDDLDLILGAYKIQPGRGPKIHNGLLSINQYLKTLTFNHVRIGIDSRNGVRDIPAHNYLLQNFTQEELSILEEVMQKAIVKILSF